MSARSFFNADDLALLLMEHPDSPQYLAVKIADAHDAAIAEALTLDDEAIEDLAAQFGKRGVPDGATEGDTLFTLYARRVAQWLRERAAEPQQ
jgi:hypothetical protein